MLLFHLFCNLFLGMWKNVYTQFSECYCYYIPYIFSIFYFECYNLLLDLVPKIIKHTERKKIYKCYLAISNCLKKLVWLLSFWIECGNNYQLLFFPESKFNVYLWNLRWHPNRFQTLRRCYGGIFNFLTLKIWEIDLLGTCYIHADFQTSRICRTAELEVPIPILFIYLFFALLLQTTS